MYSLTWVALLTGRSCCMAKGLGRSSALICALHAHIVRKSQWTAKPFVNVYWRNLLNYTHSKYLKQYCISMCTKSMPRCIFLFTLDNLHETSFVCVCLWHFYVQVLFIVTRRNVILYEQNVVFLCVAYILAECAHWEPHNQVIIVYMKSLKQNR